MKIPKNIEAEYELLGILTNTQNREIVEDIFLETDVKDFFSIEGQSIYETSLNLWKKKEPLTFVSLSEILEKNGKMEKFGGISVLTRIYGGYISDGMYRNSLAIVKSNSAGRQAMQIGQVLQSECECNPQQAIDKAVRELATIGLIKNIEMESINSIAEEADVYMREKRKGNILEEGAEMPFRKLNKILQKMTKGDVTIIAARPGVGKSAFLNEVILHNALNGKKTAMFSLEMRKREIAMRFYANIMNLSLYELTGLNKKVDTAEAKAQIQKAELYVEDGIYDLETIAKACRVQKKRHGLDLICIDYLQLMRTKGKKEDRRLEIEYISRELKLLAGELDVPIILLSQMNRAIEYEKRAPLLADLRESGAIEQDASQVVFLHQNSVKAKNLDFDPLKERYLEIYIAKNRNGAVGRCFMKFYADKMKFVEIDEDGIELKSRLNDLEQLEIENPFDEE